MNKGSVLVTDSVFIYEHHIRQFNEAGYDIVREKADMNEAEFCKAIRGKVGYICGGIEIFNTKVLRSANKLKAINFPGIGYKTYIEAYKEALQKSIRISYCPEAPTHAVAEWAISAALMMSRRLLETGRTGDLAFAVTGGLEAKNVGIVGLGRIGREVMNMLGVFKPSEVRYWNRTKYAEVPGFSDIDTLFSTCDIIFLTLGEDVGQDYINKSHFDVMKEGALLIDITRPKNLNGDDLYAALEKGKIRAASVNKREERFKKLPLAIWWATNDPSVSFTDTEVQKASAMATESMLNMLMGREDPYAIPGPNSQTSDDNKEGRAV